PYMDPVSRFVFELGQLRRIRHEGWTLAGVEKPESVAEHSLRAAQIAYLLAVMEDHENPAEACAMAVFHDVGETRIGDLHKVANRYVSADEQRAVREQTGPLGEMGSTILGLWRQVEEESSTAGVIARDADLLEMAATAREYVEAGHPSAASWIDNIAPRLRTPSARRLLQSLRTTSPHSWWQGLKEMEQKR
ncbi:MAG: HD family hydrolase, partial [Candidatus Thermoplasmatota archaeon]|nr:HD family hydrolase [Candidatus Thermoplasmatota archaeon]